MSDQIFKTLIEKLTAKQEALKETKGLMRDLEGDVPMELEELLITFKDLKKQVKEGKDKHLSQLLKDNVEYGEYREQIQELREEIAQTKLELFTEAAKQSREKGSLDQTVTVQGVPVRLQTQSEVSVYINGKVLAAKT